MLAAVITDNIITVGAEIVNNLPVSTVTRSVRGREGAVRLSDSGFQVIPGLNIRNNVGLGFLLLFFCCVLLKYGCPGSWPELPNRDLSRDVCSFFPFLFLIPQEILRYLKINLNLCLYLVFIFLSYYQSENVASGCSS